MGKYKPIPKILLIFAVFLFGAMCAVVGYNYAYLDYAGRHMGFSAPPSVAFLYAIPFIAAILVMLIIAKKLSDKG